MKKIYKPVEYVDIDTGEVYDRNIIKDLEYKIMDKMVKEINFIVYTTNIIRVFAKKQTLF